MVSPQLHVARYGSPDGGRTVACDEDAATAMEHAGAKLGLKRHAVRTGDIGTGAGEGVVHIAAPCDIEVHKGRDGRLYGSCTQRCYPP